MILPERWSVYLESLESGNSVFLEELEKEARAEQVPVIGREMQSFLKMLLSLLSPQKILEIGTGVGFSALLMAENTQDFCRITTIENKGKRLAAARANIARAGMEQRIELLSADAGDLLPRMSGPYDLIFLDAAKGQYPRYLPDLLRLLRTGGVLLADDVLQDGRILDSHYAVARRDRTIYKRMREFLYTLTHTEGLQTSLLPIGDGAAVTVKCCRKSEQ